MTRVAIIGAGAAGCFCAASLLEQYQGLSVTLFEAGPSPLAKVAVTGGGRCNLSNSFAGIRSLQEAYPRGERVMKRALKIFSPQESCAWFERRGVPLTLQEDQCWFPASQDARDIVRCLLHACQGADIRLNTPVQNIISRHPDSSFFIRTHRAEEPFDRVVVTSGGAPKGLPFLEKLELEIVPPVPSLFTFHVPDTALTALMGLVVEAGIGLVGTPFRASGPLLITDWGFSGPATLKLSSYAARHLASIGYKGSLSVNWMNAPQEQVRELLVQSAARHPRKQLSTTHLLQGRLWEHLLARAGFREDLRWAELGAKGLNRLVAILTADRYPLSGKSRFREEFVTAGGVALSNVHPGTLESKRYPGLYFAGEVLDIDAITGGFNLQAAWSTGYVCAQSIVRSL